jgi:multiple sugar transport system permease protein
MSNLHLVNSYFGLILINASFNLAFSVWILSSFFKSIPVEIEEAASIDGASRFQTFTRISLPLAVPGIVTTAIFTFIAAWNEYVVAYTLASSPSKQPFSVGLSLLTGYYEVKWNYLFAGSLIAIIPVFVLFVMIEKYLVSGLTAGSVK